MPTVAVRRGCGTRKKGAAYGETPMSEHGLPLEAYIQDPPIPIDPEEMGLSAVAVKLIERDGVYHVFDWVGEQHYPNIADFLEEARRFGVSRRLPKTLDFSKLTTETKMVLLHKRACIEAETNRTVYWDEYIRHPQMEYVWRDPCPVAAVMNSGIHSPYEMCAGLWWQDIHDGVTTHFEDKELDRLVTVKMPSFDYQAVWKPSDADPRYVPGIFASFSLVNIAVVLDDVNFSHDQMIETAQAAGVPIDLVDA